MRLRQLLAEIAARKPDASLRAIAVEVFLRNAYPSATTKQIDMAVPLYVMSITRSIAVGAGDNEDGYDPIAAMLHREARRSVATIMREGAA